MQQFQPNLSKEQARMQLASKITALSHEVFLTDTNTTAVQKEALFATKLQQLLNPPREHGDSTTVREVTVLFASLKDFTLICAEVPPAKVIEMLNRYFSSMSDLISHFGGYMGTLIGNSLLAIFDTPLDKPLKLQAVLTCAVEMQMAMSGFNETNRALNLPELTMGMGINSGAAIVGKLYEKAHFDYTFIGDDVRLAAQIEPHSLRGQVLISESTYQRIKNSIESGEPNPVHLKGKRDVVNLYELQAVKQPQYKVVPKIEVRKNLRVLINAPITYQHIDNHRLLPEIYHGEVVDLSYKGMLADVNEPLELYSEIKLTLTLSDIDNKTTDVYGKILKITKEGERFHIGVLFTNLTDHAKSAIKLFVDSMA